MDPFYLVELFYAVFVGIFLALLFVQLVYFRAQAPRARHLFSALCFLSTIYNLLSLLAVSKVSIGPGAIALVLLASSVGFLSAFLFCQTAHSILSPSRKMPLFFWAPLGIGAIFFVSLVEVALTGRSWSLVESAAGYSNEYMSNLFGPWTISGPAFVVLGLGSVSIALAYLTLFVQSLRRQPRDVFLSVGIFITMATALSDNLIGADLNPAMVPLGTIGFLPAILRFQYLLGKSGAEALQHLQSSLSHLKVLMADREVNRKTKHDLRKALDALRQVAASDPRLEATAAGIENIHLGKSPPINRSESISIADVVDQCVRVLAPAAQDRSIELRLKVKEDLLVNADFLEVFLAVFNLLQNSIEAFSQKSDGKEACIEVVLDGTSRTVLIVDNAGGIPKELENQVFVSPFTTKKGGEGLGLMSSREALLNNRALLALVKNGDQTHFKISFLV